MMFCLRMPELPASTLKIPYFNLFWKTSQKASSESGYSTAVSSYFFSSLSFSESILRAVLATRGPCLLSTVVSSVLPQLESPHIFEAWEHKFWVKITTLFNTLGLFLKGNFSGSGLSHMNRVQKPISWFRKADCMATSKIYKFTRTICGVMLRYWVYSFLTMYKSCPFNKWEDRLSITIPNPCFTKKGSNPNQCVIHQNSLTLVKAMFHRVTGWQTGLSNPTSSPTSQSVQKHAHAFIHLSILCHIA